MAKNMAMNDGMRMSGVCHRCRGWRMTVAGLVIIANALWPFLDWWMLVGILLVVGGLSKVAMPCCSHWK